MKSRLPTGVCMVVWLYRAAGHLFLYWVTKFIFVQKSVPSSELSNNHLSGIYGHIGKTLTEFSRSESLDVVHYENLCDFLFHLSNALS